MAQQTNHIGDTNKMVTAVEWLINELESEAITDYSFAQAHKLITLDVYTFNKVFEQAKQMEMQRIMQSYNDGKLAVINIDKNKSLEGYYNKTYASKGNELKQINQDNPMTRGSTALVKVTSSQTEISDEEIYKEAEKHFKGLALTRFVQGAQWYREQLKNK